jgi:prolyl-tRNA synthetase
VGPRSLAEGKVEIKHRVDGKRELLAPADAVARLVERI